LHPEEPTVELVELLECIDKGLDRFGAGVKQVVYFRMKESIGLERNGIVSSPEKFEAFLENMFGIGAAGVERSIMKEIVSTFELGAASSLSNAILRARTVDHSNPEPLTIQVKT
jgi:hypothetical protein